MEGLAVGEVVGAWLGLFDGAPVGLAVTGAPVGLEVTAKSKKIGGLK